MASKRTYVTGAILAAFGLLAIIPWSTSITIPALMTAEKEQALFAPFPAKIESMAIVDGAVVQKGDVLFQLASPQLVSDLARAEERRSLIESRIDRTGSDDQDRASLIVLTNELKEVNEQIEGFQRVREQMTIRAPFAGTVADLDPELHAGLWVNPKNPMGVLQSGETARIKGYVSERNVFRFEPGARARFIPDNRELPIVETQVMEVAEASSEQLDEHYLALPFGGSIAIEEAQKDQLRPTEAEYAVGMVPRKESVGVPQKAVRGVSIISGEPESFYTRAKRQVLKVFVREMGV